MNCMRLASLLLASLPAVFFAQSAPEPVDLRVLHQIKPEAFLHSQAMEMLFYISDVYGPCITSSPNHKAAAEYIMSTLQRYGLKNVHLEPWEPFDNGTGSTVAIEAVRILTSLHRPMDRTVRIALWGGEEEGLLGSLAYVQKHFAPRDTMAQTPEYAKLDAYYNDDTGSGRFRGISADGNDEIAAIFRQWAAPIRDLESQSITGATAAPTRQPGGTDSTTFSWIGLDGFNFVQDPLEYGSRTHHSNMDLYDRVQPGDVMQGAAVEAWFVYNTATRSQMLPRLDTPSALAAK